MTSADVEELYEHGTLDCEAARDLPCHTGLVLHTGSASALARVLPDKQIQLVRGDREAFGLHGRSAEQRIALDLLLDPEIGIVSMGGRAGTGKSALALCAGLEAVMERRQHRKVIVFRPLYPVGGQDLGYLPGSESEKMGPWAQAVYDTLSSVTTQEVIDELVARDMFEVLPLTHIRGRSACTTRSSSWTRRSRSSAACCSPCCPGSAPAPASCSPTTSRSETTCASAGTTA